MREYVAFLRGINVGGKNKIVMSELKEAFIDMEFYDVSTYLNSGNVMFFSDKDNIVEIRTNIEELISKRFGLSIPVYVIEKEYLKRIIENAPTWWGLDDKEKYDNLIFILSENTANVMCEMIGPISKELERAQVYENVIFWTFDRKLYQKCNWWKNTAREGIAEKLTIRTANTVKRTCR